MTYAKTSYLQHLGNAGWPKKHVDALAHFFIALEASSFHSCTHGKKILIIYQAHIQHHWHDQLKQEGNGGFNIAIINLGLLETILTEVWDVVHTENKRVVSPPCSPFPIQACHANNATCLFPPLHIYYYFLSSCYTPSHHATPGCYTSLATHSSCYTCVQYTHLRACFTCSSPATPPFSFHVFPKQILACCVILIKYTMPTALFPHITSLLYLHNIYTHHVPWHI